MKRTSINVWVLTLGSFLGVIGCSTLSTQVPKAAAVAKACQGKEVGDEVTIHGQTMKCWADKKIIRCSDADFRACAGFSNEKTCRNDSKSCCWWVLDYKKCEPDDKPDIAARKTIQCIGRSVCVCYNGNCTCGSKNC